MTIQSPRRPTLSENRGNCLLYGCVTLVLVAVLVSIFGWLTFRYAVGQVRERYTAAAPINLPAVNMAQDRIDATIESVDQFSDAVEDGEPAPALVLDQDQINALIQHHPDFSDIAHTVYVTLEDDTITGDLSIPIDGIPGFGGRYFNGSATFKAALEDTGVTLYVDQASYKGEPVPENILQSFRAINLVENWQSNPEADDFTNNLESFEIKDGILTITPKALAPAEEATSN